RAARLLARKVVLHPRGLLAGRAAEPDRHGEVVASPDRRGSCDAPMNCFQLLEVIINSRDSQERSSAAMGHVSNVPGARARWKRAPQLQTQRSSLAVSRIPVDR